MALTGSAAIAVRTHEDLAPGSAHDRNPALGGAARPLDSGPRRHQLAGPISAQLSRILSRSALQTTKTACPSRFLSTATGIRKRFGVPRRLRLFAFSLQISDFQRIGGFRFAAAPRQYLDFFLTRRGSSAPPRSSWSSRWMYVLSVKDAEWWPSQCWTWTAVRPFGEHACGDRMPERVEARPRDARLLARRREHPAI